MQAMKLLSALWLPALALLFVANAVHEGRKIEATGTAPRLPLRPASVARCTPFADGSCGACTNCKYCAWCNANPDNHCTTCLSSRNSIATAK